VLTALNLLNYADRNVLFAVQPLVQDEFHLSKTQIGYLTSAFLGFYMVAAPFVGPLADRYSRKLIIVLGAIFWSALTLLTAFTHTYTELLIRHTLVGIGEATFVTIAPTFVADLFAEKSAGASWAFFIWRSRWDRRRAICWEEIWLRTMDGVSVLHCGGTGLSAGAGRPVSERAGAREHLIRCKETRGARDRARVGAIRHSDFDPGHGGNDVFAGRHSGGCQQFLYSERHYSLEAANFMFGIIIVVDGILASLAGGWLGDYLLPRMKVLTILVSAASMALGVPVMIVALFARGAIMVPAIAVAAFFLLLNTSPLERGGDQLGRCAHSRHRARGKHFHHSHSGRCAFAHDDGLCGG
jgi:hypothetical protein